MEEVMLEGGWGEETRDLEGVEDSPFEFDDSDCETELVRGAGKGNIMAPEQLDKARWRDVCTISKVCEIDEQTAHELLVREGWDHQKVLDLHFPFQGYPEAPSDDVTCPVCQESCAVGSSNGIQYFELCNHPIHTACGVKFLESEITSMAGMSQERFKGSVTCPWCIVFKAKTPGFFSEGTVEKLISKELYETYKRVRRNTLARNERHCTKEGCMNVVRFSSLKLSPGSCTSLECGCSHRFCLLCGAGEHWPASCQNVVSWHRLQSTIKEQMRSLNGDIEGTRHALRQIRTELANIDVPRALVAGAAQAQEANGNRAQERVDLVEAIEADEMEMEAVLPAAAAGPVVNDILGRERERGRCARQPRFRKCLPMHNEIRNHLMRGGEGNASVHGARGGEMDDVRSGSEKEKSSNPEGCRVSGSTKKVGIISTICQKLFKVSGNEQPQSDVNSDPGEGGGIQMGQSEGREDGKSCTDASRNSCRVLAIDTARDEEGRAVFAPSEMNVPPEHRMEYTPFRMWCLGGKYKNHGRMPDSQSVNAATPRGDLPKRSSPRHSDNRRLRFSESQLWETSHGIGKRSLQGLSDRQSPGGKVKKFLRNKRSLREKKTEHSEQQHNNTDVIEWEGTERAQRVFSAPENPLKDCLHDSSSTEPPTSQDSVKNGHLSVAPNPSVSEFDGELLSHDIPLIVDGTAANGDPVDEEGHSAGSRGSQHHEILWTNAENHARGSDKKDGGSNQGMSRGRDLKPVAPISDGGRIGAPKVQEQITGLSNAESSSTIVEADSAGSGSQSCYIARHIKDCPRCFCLCEKLGGCDHVKCPRCDHHFCWKCRADWRISGGYKHLQNCTGEPVSAPTKDEAEEQYRAFLDKHGEREADKATTREEFVNDWMQREKEMRTMFEYHGEQSPRWNAEMGALFAERQEAVLARLEQLRREENTLEQQLQNQQRDLEWRKRFHVNQCLQENAERPQGNDEMVMDLECDDDYSRYLAVVKEENDMEQTLKHLEGLKTVEQEFQYDCCSQLIKILLSCESSIWAFRLHRFFNPDFTVSGMVEFNVAELEHSKNVSETLAKAVQQVDGGDDAGTSSSSDSESVMSFGAMASNAEYFKRKRNNFIRAWEEMIREQRGQ